MGARKTQFGCSKRWALGLATCLLAIGAHGQATLDSGGLDVTLRFVGYTPNDPDEPDCGIEELLEEDWTAHDFWTESLDTTPVLKASKSQKGLPGLDFDEPVCLNLQAVDGQSGMPGLRHLVHAGTWFDQRREFFTHESTPSDLLFPFDDPDNACDEDPNTLDLLIETCPGIVRVHFVEAESWFENDPHLIVPVVPERFDVRSVAKPASPEFNVFNRLRSWQAGAEGLGQSSVAFAAASGADTWAWYEVHTGSDFNLDTFVTGGVSIFDGASPFASDDADSAVIPCDKIRDFYVPIPAPGDGSPCSVSGLLDVIGESEGCDRGFDLAARAGPHGHARGAKIGDFGAANEPCDTTHHATPWVLRNLHCDLYRRIEATSVLRGGHVRLTWPLYKSAFPEAPSLGPGFDIGDYFVSEPGLMRGRVRLTTGNPDLLGLRRLVHPSGDVGAWLGGSGSQIRAVGLSHLAGESLTAFDLDDTFDPATGTRQGRYETVVTGPRGADGPWRISALRLVLSSPVPDPLDTAALDPSDWLKQASTVEEDWTPRTVVEMGGAPTELDLEHCFGRLTVLFHSNVPFRFPTLHTRRAGTWPTVRWPYRYRTYGSAAGLPLLTENRFVRDSRVVSYLPEGRGYEFVASVRTANGSHTQLPLACDVDILCGQDVRIDGPLTLNVEAAPCTTDNSQEVTVTAEAFICEGAGPGEVTEVRWENLTTGDSDIVCSGSCAGTHVFEITGLAPCENRVRIIAQDDAVPPHVSVSEFSINGDSEPPEVVGGCAPADSSRVFQGFEWTDGCGGPVTQTCDPPVGSVLTEGEHDVTCTASDGCNEATCSTTLHVRANTPPACEAGRDLDAGCDGVQLQATASDPDGDPLFVHWSSSCAGTSFEPGPDVLDPLVSFGANCDVDCRLDLTVSDGVDLCNDSLRVRIDDVEPPSAACSVSAPGSAPVAGDACPDAILLECTGPDGAEASVATTATDSCSSVALSNDRAGHEGEASFTDWFALGCGEGLRSEVVSTAADDCGNTANCCVSVTVVDTTPPALSGCPADLLVSCPSDVPPPARVLATDVCDLSPSLTMSEQVAGDVPCDYTITRTWTTEDACGNVNACSRVITVRDEEGPVFTQQPALSEDGPAWLWPPNHGYVDFDLGDTGAVAEDACGGPVSLRFADCASSQPEDDLGDGHSERDCVISEDGQRLSLRAERSGTCPGGRSYTVTMVAVDECGNETVSEGFGACVPHDRRRPATGEVFSAAPGSTQKDERPGSNGGYGTDCGRGCD